MGSSVLWISFYVYSSVFVVGELVFSLYLEFSSVLWLATKNYTMQNPR